MKDVIQTHRLLGGVLSWSMVCSLQRLFDSYSASRPIQMPEHELQKLSHLGGTKASLADKRVVVSCQFMKSNIVGEWRMVRSCLAPPFAYRTKRHDRERPSLC